MVELDDTDREILQLLLEDARRSYKDIGDHVGLSSPSVSHRIDHLEELGVIGGFTLNIDRSTLTIGDSVLIEIDARPGRAEQIVESLAEVELIENVFQSVDTRITATGYMNDQELTQLFTEELNTEYLDGYEVRMLTKSIRNPTINHADLAIECVECGKPIQNEGITMEIEEHRYYLCCTSCKSLFQDRYQKIQDGTQNEG